MTYTPPIGSVALHLKGRYTPPAGTVALHIGASDDSDRSAVIRARSESRAAIRALETRLARVIARSAASRAIVGTAWDPNLLSDVVSRRETTWQAGARRTAHARDPFSDSSPALAPAQIRWRKAQTIHSGCVERWRSAESLRGAHGVAWRAADPVRQSIAEAWRDAESFKGSAAPDWGEAKDLPAPICSTWLDLPLILASLSTRWRDAELSVLPLLQALEDAVPLRVPLRTRWRDAAYLPYLLGSTDPVIPEPEPTWRPVPHLCIRFPLPGTALHIGLACPGVTPDTPIIVPVRRVYYVLNSVSLVRVADGVQVPATAISLDLSADSWSWSWSATVPGFAEALVRDTPPVELIATINGAPIRLVVGSVQRERAFGSSTLQVRGQGRAALLTDPVISRHNTESRTAQQLLEDALTVNGVPIGWTVDWKLEDWTVPAGYWSQTGTYIEAANRLAEAGGGYVQGHDTAQTLRILPWYPHAPWDWPETEPDIVLPENACRTEGIEWSSQPGYNAVWVTGGTRRDRIKRAGSAGDAHAPTIVDSLATDVVMTRQRGLRVLAETGAQAVVSVSLPLLDEVGIIHPGKLVRYTEQGRTHLGMARAVSVSCGFPDVWQTVKIETRPQ